ncbi:MAG: hypothetical protein AAGA20_22800 [Planctomycetota bacterium]
MATVGPEPPFFPLRVLGVALRWAPVWVPALVLWQIVSGGLEPALAEKKRLDDARPVVERRHERSTDEFEQMSAERRAWDDPVYRERIRRVKRDAVQQRDR